MPTAFTAQQLQGKTVILHSCPSLLSLPLSMSACHLKLSQSFLVLQPSSCFCFVLSSLGSSRSPPTPLPLSPSPSSLPVVDVGKKRDKGGKQEEGEHHRG